jgi:hypothetical protein
VCWETRQFHTFSTSTKLWKKGEIITSTTVGWWKRPVPKSLLQSEKESIQDTGRYQTNLWSQKNSLITNIFLRGLHFSRDDSRYMLHLRISQVILLHSIPGKKGRTQNSQRSKFSKLNYEVPNRHIFHDWLKTFYGFKYIPNLWVNSSLEQIYAKFMS